MMIIAATAFTFGVKVGRSYAFREAEVEMEDHAQVELLSAEEERMNQVVKSRQRFTGGTAHLDEFNKKLERQIRAQISAVPSRQLGELPPKKGQGLPEARRNWPLSKGVRVPQSAKSDIQVGGSAFSWYGKRPRGSYSGKHTIQMGSHRGQEEAKDFAEGFRARGYEPIIDKVNLPDRGIWYRVSIGAFETLEEAKRFVKKEPSLFQGQDHVFVRFD